MADINDMIREVESNRVFEFKKYFREFTFDDGEFINQLKTGFELGMYKSFGELGFRLSLSFDGGAKSIYLGLNLLFIEFYFRAGDLWFDCDSKDNPNEYINAKFNIGDEVDKTLVIKGKITNRSACGDLGFMYEVNGNWWNEADLI